MIALRRQCHSATRFAIQTPEQSAGLQWRFPSKDRLLKCAFHLRHCEPSSLVRLPCRDRCTFAVVVQTRCLDGIVVLSDTTTLQRSTAIEIACTCRYQIQTHQSSMFYISNEVGPLHDHPKSKIAKKTAGCRRQAAVSTENT